ncbi:MAG: Fur family transcriptional regulator [Sulfurifustaceae bacterium]
MFEPRNYTDSEVSSLLRERGISPTAQRVLITRTLFARGTHLAAEDLFRTVNKDTPNVSKATVYNTLGLLASKGIIREVIADPTRVFYDPNTAPHHHLYDEVSGELTDIDAAEVDISSLPALPENAELRGVDVIIRIRRNGKK